MNDRYGNSWPGDGRGDDGWPAEEPQWPGEPQGRGGWPSGDEAGHQWPGQEPERPRQPPRRPQGRPQGGPPPRDHRGAPPPPPPQHGGGYRPPPPDQPPLPPRRGAAPAAGAAGFPEREPELITHHEHNGTTDPRGHRDDYDDYDYDDRDDVYTASGAEGYDDEPPARGKGGLTVAERKKRRWRRVRRVAYVMVGLFVVIPAVAFAVAYFVVDVPTPEEVAAKQNKVVTYYYGDGQTELGRDIPPGGNRQILKYEQMAEITRKAVYATEDSTFETNAGFDLTAILRAVYNQVTAGVGGGSTISQQYIKKATENEEYTLTRKAVELVQSFKMNNEQEKPDIITAYLNTIYFGRGAYGVATAAEAYFGKKADQLDYSESALLAGLIQQPGRSENRAVAEERWRTALDRMLQNGWITPQQRAEAKFPTIRPLEEARPEPMDGPDQFVKARIKEELEAKGYPESKVKAGGYKIYTTIDQNAQAIAKKTVTEVMKGQPEKLKEALVAVDPKTGGVLAYYGGPRIPNVDMTDWANVPRNPGSSYKPFDLVALLEKDKGLGEIYNGRSGSTFGGSKPIRNSTNCSSDQCTVAEAMEKSVNTVFVDMVVNDTGVDAVIEAARAAGIPAKVGNVDTMQKGDSNIAIGGGNTQVTTADMATAYATFAANGVHRDQHFVSKITDADGNIVEDFSKPKEKIAFANGDADKSKQIAGNVTKSLTPVLPYSKLTCAEGRDCAGKTGTHQAVDHTNDNAQAWMVGYSPQVSAAAWVGTGEGPSEIIRDARNRPIYGKDLPGEMWQKFMNEYLKGKPKDKFEDVKPIGRVEAPPSSSKKETESSAESPTSSTSSSENPSSTESPTSSSKTNTKTNTRTPDIPWPGAGNQNGRGEDP
ncbi:transglycosylase domain-containing protein [Amycolatopsis suaedae]|uniref:Penicillin-binding protein n=1 Tax=Amycolatopsis suaedae TaxID=2510978 RepID=A0A4Q7JD57_9PSEU|nr:transglycosylase domain-containing protein [Amycolatopsis suaedae]RZQ65068.1 penicillin-binding protein [Amycolatopsis suaedae]